MLHFLSIKVVELNLPCRKQQLRDGSFPALAAVPARALSLTVPAVLRSRAVSCVAAGARLAPAVRRALQGCVGAPCPASSLRAHSNCELWLDAGSAALLDAPSVRLHPALFPGFVDLQVRREVPTSANSYFEGR